MLSAKNINTSLSYSTKYNTTILNLSFILLLLASCTQEELLDGLSNQQATSEENLAGVPAETSVTQAQAVAVANQILGCRSSQTRSKSTPPPPLRKLKQTARRLFTSSTIKTEDLPSFRARPHTWYNFNTSRKKPLCFT